MIAKHISPASFTAPEDTLGMVMVLLALLIIFGAMATTGAYTGRVLKHLFLRRKLSSLKHNLEFMADIAKRAHKSVLAAALRSEASSVHSLYMASDRVLTHAAAQVAGQFSLAGATLLVLLFLV